MDLNKWKFNDNFIYIDSNKEYCCFACNERLKDEGKVAKHISRSKHLKKIEKIFPRLTYKNEKVYEVRDMCYCKYCNQRLYKKEVEDHISKSEFHKVSKQNWEIILGRSEPRFRNQSSDDVDRYEFSGIIKGVCYFCDHEIIHTGEEEGHINGSAHRANSLQYSNVEDVGYGNYREVKDEFICFLCRDVYPLIDKDAHFVSENHMSIALTKIMKNPQVRPNTSKEEKRDEGAQKAYSLRKIAALADIFKTQEDFYDYVKELSKAKCKTCHQLLDINYKALLDHRKGHESKISKTTMSKGKFTGELPPGPYLNENYGIHRRYTKCVSETLRIDNVLDGRYFFCRVCYVYISPKTNHIVQHILGVSHREIVYANIYKKGGPICKNDDKLVTMRPYVKTFYHVPELKMYLINGICINMRSFLLVDVISDKTNNQRGKMVCYVCEETFPDDEEMNHYETNLHYRGFLSGRIVKTFKEEFIREIPEDIYHCGYCNKLFSLRVLNKHLESWKHQKAKQKHLALSNLVSSWYGLGTYVSYMSYPELYAFIITSIEEIMYDLKKPEIKECHSLTTQEI